MRIGEALEYRARLFALADRLAISKSKGYAAPHDIFTNMRACEVFGIMSAELGAWVRLSDKVARLGSLLRDRGDPEAVLDTVVDLINYASYVYLLLMEKDPAYARLLEGKKDVRQVREG
jgi:hypothetical protein